MSRANAPALLGAALVASAGFAGAAIASASRASAHLDRRLEPRLAFRPRSRARRLAEVASPAGKWYVLGPVAVVAGASIARRRRRRVAGTTIAASGVASAALSLAFDRILPQPPVPAGHRSEPNKPIFPSGHAFVSTAIALTAAYVAIEEDLLPRSVALPLAAVLPLGNTALKLGARKHWVSDALGGIAAGISLAAICCAAYELSRD